jgi:hypothetical protein
MNRDTINAARRETIARIRKLIEPKLHDTGWVKNPLSENSRPLRAFAFRENLKTIRMYGFTLGDIHGVTEDGVIDDIHVGLVTTPWDSIPLEDLLDLETLIQRRLKK